MVLKYRQLKLMWYLFHFWLSTKKGHRVGYGKGFYDKFLSECKPDAIKIGLSFFEPEELITDVFESDVKLDYCVTPNSIHAF